MNPDGYSQQKVKWIVKIWPFCIYNTSHKKRKEGIQCIKPAPAASNKSQTLSLSLFQREDFFASLSYNANPLTKAGRWLTFLSTDITLYCSP